MRWAYRVARVSGIDIKVHVTFLFIVLLFGANWGFQHGTAGFGFGVLLVAALFACVTLHELGHSLAAQAFGITVREIILLPIGGVALLERTPAKPIQEFAVAVAGPLVNVIIAVLLVPPVVLSGDLTMLSGSVMVQGTAVELSLHTLLLWLLEANILLVLFNIIPAFPLDGGRMLRALLAMRFGMRRATRIASRVGQGFAILIGLLGLVALDLFLVLIAVFIYFGARQETSQEEASTVLSTRRVGDAYNKHVLTLEVGDRIAKVLDYVLTSYQPDFAVLQGPRLIGVVTRDDALRAVANGPAETYVPDVYVTTIMRRDVLRASADDTLEEVRRAMLQQNTRIAAVYEDDTYLGLVNMDDIAEAFAVLAFLERYGRREQPPSDADRIQPTGGASTG
jgi:Zn-dependent protease